RVRAVDQAEARAGAGAVVDGAAAGALEGLAELVRGDGPAGGRLVAADAAPAVGAEVLEELGLQVDLAGGADRSGVAAVVAERHAVGQHAPVVVVVIVVVVVVVGDG